MKRKILQRVLSVILALVMLISGSPAAYAAQVGMVAEIPVEMEQAVTETEAPETRPAVQFMQPVEMTEAVPEPEASEEMAPAEETSPGETVAEETVAEETILEETTPEETAAEEIIWEETVPEALFCDFTGMPEDYVLSSEALEKKQAMIDNGVLKMLETLIPGEDYEESQIIAAAETREEAERIAEAFDGTLAAYIGRLALIELLTATVPEAVAASLDMERNLPAVSPNYLSPVNSVPVSGGVLKAVYQLPERQDWDNWNWLNDPALQDPGSSTYQWVHDAVDTYAAWGVTTGEPWVKVAVIDSGVQADHPELRGHITEYSVGCGTGDLIGQGTHTAGIIAAAMCNSAGGVGIAPGVSIQSYRCTNDSGHGGMFWKLAAIIEAVNNGAHIITLGMGSYGYDFELQNIILDAVDSGVTVIAATGDDGSNTVQYPAAYDGVIAVAATDRSGNRAHYSNYGDWVDISAPGDNLYSSYNDGGYCSMGGTAMAAAVVAGVAALYTSARGERVAPAEMERVLKASATKVSDKGMGAGQVNAANLFGGKPDAPYCYVQDEEGQAYDLKKPVPCEGYLYLSQSKDLAENGGTGDTTGILVYTLNGKAPVIDKNSEVDMWGETIQDSTKPWIETGLIYDRSKPIDLREYAGETLTVKAVYINGMGVIGKVLSQKITVAKSSNIRSVYVYGGSQMMPGKSQTFIAEVSGKDWDAEVDQTVTWSITSFSASMAKAKIDKKTGKLTVPAGKTGYVTVQATSVADPSVSGEMTVYVEELTPVGKIELPFKNAFTYVGSMYFLDDPVVKDIYGNILSPYDVDLVWTSSNPNVASIDQWGCLEGISKGTATITCAAADGSGKSAKFKVEVRQFVEFLWLDGASAMAPGSNATMKVAAVSPADANNKKVTWEIKGEYVYDPETYEGDYLPAPQGVTVDAKSGKVTVASSVPVGTKFTVHATAQDAPPDHWPATNSQSVTVVNKCTGVEIQTNNSAPGLAKGATLNKNGTVKTVELFSVDIPDAEGYDFADDDNLFKLEAVLLGTEHTHASWTSSDPSVASVNYEGYVTAHKAGTAKITLTALDGSNKKASCTIKVTNPVSSLSITSGVPRVSDDFFGEMHYAAIGKNVKNTVTFADTYGKPANQKVEWSIAITEWDAEGNYVKHWGELEDQKLITVKNGTLSVKAGVKQYWENIEGKLLITVYADATDGTGVWEAVDYLVVPPATAMKIDNSCKTVTTPTEEQGTAYFYSDQLNRFCTDWNTAFTVTSSNPMIVSFASVEPCEENGWYKITYNTGRKTGSAKFTIKTTDGSNKSCSFTVKVPY